MAKSVLNSPKIRSLLVKSRKVLEKQLETAVNEFGTVRTVAYDTNTIDERFEGPDFLNRLRLVEEQMQILNRMEQLTREQ